MPTRYLKQGICDSDAINALSDGAECLFYRLLVTVDDFGRADGRALVIKSRSYPIKESVTVKVIEQRLAELEDQGIIVRYVVDGRPYFQMQKWDNKPRAGSSKFPQPPDESEHLHNDDLHLHTDVNHLNTSVPLTVTETVTETRHQSAASPVGFAEFWLAYPKKVGKGAAESSWKKHRPSLPAVLLAIGQQAKSEQWAKDGGQFIPNPATWLNQKRWEDGSPPGAISSGLSPLPDFMRGAI
jgi:hypothetical protein